MCKSREETAQENRRRILSYARELRTNDYEMIEYAVMKMIDITGKALDGASVNDLIRILQYTPDDQINAMGVMLHDNLKVTVFKEVTREFIARTVVDYARSLESQES